MEAFGICFSVGDHDRFARLATLFEHLKSGKAAGIAGHPEGWKTLVPDDVKSNFGAPDEEARMMRIANRPPIIIGEPSDQIGATWDFYRVFESIEDGDYELLTCEMVAPNMAEIRINPFGYPYGGLGPFIALAEAFGFRILGVNEYGKYQSREEIIGDDSESVN
jgi:hypothetical protein